MSNQTMPSFPKTETDLVAEKLCDLCDKGKYDEALSLYADNARHVEAMSMPGCDRIIEGKANIIKKAEEFAKSTTVHDASCSKPRVNGDQFVCEMMIDCTHAEGPFAGQRMKMTETCLYTVKDGKITEAKFFYSMC